MLLWADFPSGSLGLYGDTIAYMLNGLYAEAGGSIDTDPDPNIGAAGHVLAMDSFILSTTRWVLPTTQDIVGISQRIWLTTLPLVNIASPYLFSFRTTGNSFIATVTIDTTGRLRVHAGDHDAAIVASSINPVIIANAWQHIEIKLTQGAAAAGEVEIRVGGQVVVDEGGLTFANPSTPVAQIGYFLPAVGSAPILYLKDIVIWDGTGVQNNTFLGQVSVFGLIPDADEDLGGWIPSYGADGFPLIADRVPMNTLTTTSLPGTSGQRVRINATYYSFVTGSVDAGAPAGTAANPWLVARGASAAVALGNLQKAINATGVAGMDYSTALVIHPDVAAVGLSAIAMAIWSKDETTTAYTCTTEVTFTSWGAATMVTGLPNDLTYISADYLLPAPCEFGLSNLPEGITSVRGLVSLVRAAKVDGGDGNMQVSLTPNGVDYEVGADRSITTAFTYYRDVSELSPDTAGPWTPAEVDSVRVRIDRTL